MERLYNDIVENLKHIRHGINEAALLAGRKPDDISLMAVTKTVPAYAVNIAIAHGINLLGENRAQELTQKYGDYDKEGVSIHFIGHLQTNKVKQIIGMVDMIHSVDSLKLATEIDKQAGIQGKIMDVLIEVNSGGEETKSGVPPEEVELIVEEISGFENIRLRGLMTIPPVYDTLSGNEACFERVYKLFIDIKAKNRDNRSVNILSIDKLSMGMSQDYQAAIRHGANIIRLGTAIFGSRQ